MKKVTMLERIYDDMDKAYRDVSPDQVKEEMEKLQKEIDGKKVALSNVNDQKKEALEKDINTLEKRMNNMKGYSKNKVQIEKIRDYKANLEQKLVQETEKKEKSIANLKKMTTELESVVKQLKDKKYTMSLDQYEYNDLLEKREKLEKGILQNQETKDSAINRITELKAKIGKCDLAWKTLFTNKGWAEIQRRAMSDEKRFTRKVDEKNQPIKFNNSEKNKRTTYNKEEVKAGIAENVKKIMDEKENKENNLPAKISRWSKFKNFFKNIPGKLKQAFSKTQEKPEEKSGEKPEERQASESETRDQFLEGLRQYVDEEYKKQVKEEKEKAYVEAHKVKPREQKNASEKDER